MSFQRQGSEERVGHSPMTMTITATATAMRAGVRAWAWHAVQEEWMQRMTVSLALHTGVCRSTSPVTTCAISSSYQLYSLSNPGDPPIVNRHQLTPATQQRPDNEGCPEKPLRPTRSAPRFLSHSFISSAHPHPHPHSHRPTHATYTIQCNAM